MKVPVGFCIELLKSIYGLKQASRLFHQLLVTFLLTLGFVAIYVDDLLLFTTTIELANEITAKLKAKFNCVDLGEITWCLGMRITTSPDRHTITLDL
jgi:hypothetical protein